ncbi:MAG: hypothetical protein IKQ25_02935 [Lachnospiraceae bacterium]|nr:hypothetical protein [Lachnospiraceae bacterium]
MKYKDVVEKAIKARRKPYGNGVYAPCETWLAGNQINLWTYWQGYQLKDIDENHVDVLLVGQDWGNPGLDKNADAMERIKKIQAGEKAVGYDVKLSPTDRNLAEMFKAFGEKIDISKDNPGMRLFFTNYSLGYRTGRETGGMTKGLMKEDKEFFDELVLAIQPKIIICLGKLTYEMVSGQITKDFCKRLQEGKPFKAPFPLKRDIMVYGVAHCGSRGSQNVGGPKKMKSAWNYVAEQYHKLEAPAINTIQAEWSLAQEKMIATITVAGKELVVLSRDNVAKVEAMIRNDSSYLQSTNKDAKMIIGKNGKVKYGGSSAYWMTMLKEALLSKNQKLAYPYEQIIEHAVEAVDRENSTHLNADFVGRAEIVKRICSLSRSELLECLRDPEKNELKLFQIIAQKTSAERRARKNASFASKFCHYACFYVFEGTKYQDNYMIYDSILKKVLPRYLDYYELKRYDLDDYAQYREAVDAIREASGVEISRNGFDHLLWYYHKGRE